MATKFKNGQKIRQVMSAPVEGVVARFVFDEISGDIDVVMQSIDAEGNIHESVFGQDEVEAVVE